jgi:hypothetical protein
LRPYGQADSIFGAKQAVTVQPLANRLLLDPLTQRYVEVFSRVRVPCGTPVIDLSGGGPGTLLLLNSKQPVIPWIAHITPHAADIVWQSLSASQKARAWVVGPVNPVFEDTNAARAIASRPYVEVASAKMKFWGSLRRIELLRPNGASTEAPSFC